MCFALKSPLYNFQDCDKFASTSTYMRIAISFLALIAVGAFCGCAGPERKLGRGINNMTEFARGGEMRRSIEQTAIWEGPEAAYTSGFFRGLNRSITRTAIGVYEVVTAPLPPYHALLT